MTQGVKLPSESYFDGNEEVVYCGVRPDRVLSTTGVISGPIAIILVVQNVGVVEHDD